MLNLDALNTFLAVVEYGGFSEAARHLHISQPAVSQIIQGLEKNLGVSLFTRQGRSAYLSEAGQVLKPLAQELLTSSRRIAETMSSLQGEVIGEFAIGCSTASGKYLLPGLIARFRHRFPQVRINVLVSSRESVINKLLAGSVALAVTSKKLEHQDLEYQDFFDDEIILIAPAKHHWATFGRIFPDDLLDEPMIVREEVSGTRQVMCENLRGRDITPDMLNVIMELGNAEAISMAVEEGLGVAFISRLAAARGLELGRIVEIKIEGMELRRSIYMARNRRQPLTRAQIELWEFTRQHQALSQRPDPADPLPAK